jgi:hypothetical protein
LYMAPDLDKELAEKVARAWANDALVLQALEDIHGGSWLDLPAERRMELALEKHLSEMAFYLWTTNFLSVEHREGLEKMKQAREVLRMKLTGEKDPDDFTQAFARMAMSLTQNMADATSRRKQVPEQTSDGFSGLKLPKIPM